MQRSGQQPNAEIVKAEQAARFAVLLDVLDEKIDQLAADLDKRVSRLEWLVVSLLLATIAQLVGIVTALLRLK